MKKIEDMHEFMSYDIPYISNNLSLRIHFYADDKENYGFKNLMEAKCFIRFLMFTYHFYRIAVWINTMLCRLRKIVKQTSFNGDLYYVYS